MAVRKIPVSETIEEAWVRHEDKMFGSLTSDRDAARALALAVLDEAGHLVRALSADTNIDGWVRLRARIEALGR